MKTKITHCMIHAADTPEGVYFDGNHILQWHMLPFKQPDGKIKYKSKIYNSVDELPNEMIGGLPVKKNFGSRGWSRPGYRKVLLLDGVWQDIWIQNDDGYLDEFEFTNGILSSSRLYRSTIHLCYIGGRGKNGQPKDTRTSLQLPALETEIKRLIGLYPWIEIIGHNQENARACPCFNVPDWCRQIGIEEKNISGAPLLYQI